MEERYFLLHFCAIFFMAENIVHISQMTIALLLMWKLFAYLFAREFIVFSVICTTVFAVIHIPLKYIAYFFVFLFYFHSTIFYMTMGEIYIMVEDLKVVLKKNRRRRNKSPKKNLRHKMVQS